VAYSAVIVDDVPHIRALFRMFLEDAGVAVIGEGRTGVEAVEQAVRLAPDVIVLDLSMPEMDGLQAITQIRRRAPKTQVVVVSGFAASRMASLALEVGAAAYVEKGAPEAEIIAAVLDACADGGPP
jgi:DNA-binding NarL/FixJ family response regulator